MSNPIWASNTTSTVFFEPGELALRAVGTDATEFPQPGALLWLKNSGDAFLYSGSLTQYISVSDSTESIDINGSSINLESNTNIAAIQAFNITTNSLGLSSSRWGLKNPLTGVFANSISISTVGTINIGLQDPLLGTLLSGISFSTIPSLSAPLVPNVSVIGLSINMTAAQISLTGLTSFTGNVNIAGATTINGATSITGATSVTGSTSITGNLGIIFPTVFSFTGVVLPNTPATSAIGATGRLPVIINGAPSSIPFYTP